MSLDSGRNNKSVIIYILIVISISFLVIPENITSNIQVTVASPLVPAQKMIAVTSNFFLNGFRKLASIARNADENKEREKEIFLLENEIIKQQNIINVLKKKLEVVSEFQKDVDSDEKPVIADIIGYDASNFRKSIIINAGKKQGVSVNDVVAFGNALVGRVSSSGNSSSRVMLITDTASNVPSRFLKSRLQGMVQGTSGDMCIMKYVPRQTDVDESDKVISSGIGGIFPEALYIGNVVQVKQKNAKLFKDIKIIPRINISKIEHVLIIKKRSGRNIAE